jgi:hypothetical protein
MRTVGIIIAVVAAGLAAAVFGGLIKFDAGAGVCRHNEEIDPALRDGATAAARTFFETLLSGDGEAAYAMLTAETQGKLARAAFDGAMMKTLANGPYADLLVQDTFEPDGADSGGKSLCTASGNQESISLSALPDATQIHAVFSATTRNNGWAMTAWLVKRAESWRVHAYRVSLASIVGHDADALLAMANAQEKKGNTLSAHMLYGAAKAAADRGPDFQLGIRQEIDAALAEHKTPPELAGEPPYTWRFGEESFEIDKVTLIGVDKRLGLMFMLRDPTWDGRETGKAEKHNKRLIDAFVKAHPQYAETFAFLVARTLEPGKDSGWGTVFDAVKGYDMGEPTAKATKSK